MSTTSKGISSLMDTFMDAIPPEFPIEGWAALEATAVGAMLSQHCAAGGMLKDALVVPYGA
jgi:hypothetical protein